jgi:hypothetical protein
MKNLNEILDYMNSVDETVDLSNLPYFGSIEPDEAHRMAGNNTLWSWDDENAIIGDCSDDWGIVPWSQLNSKLN